MSSSPNNSERRLSREAGVILQITDEKIVFVGENSDVVEYIRGKNFDASGFAVGQIVVFRPFEKPKIPSNGPRRLVKEFTPYNDSLTTKVIVDNDGAVTISTSVLAVLPDQGVEGSRHFKTEFFQKVKEIDTAEKTPNQLTTLVLKMKYSPEGELLSASTEATDLSEPLKGLVYKIDYKTTFLHVYVFGCPEDFKMEETPTHNADNLFGKWIDFWPNKTFTDVDIQKPIELNSDLPVENEGENLSILAYCYMRKGVLYTQDEHVVQNSDAYTIKKFLKDNKSFKRGDLHLNCLATEENEIVFELSAKNETSTTPKKSEQPTSENQRLRPKSSNSNTSSGKSSYPSSEAEYVEAVEAAEAAEAADATDDVEKLKAEIKQLKKDNEALRGQLEIEQKSNNPLKKQIGEISKERNQLNFQYDEQLRKTEDLKNVIKEMKKANEDQESIQRWADSLQNENDNLKRKNQELTVKNAENERILNLVVSSFEDKSLLIWSGPVYNALMKYMGHPPPAAQQYYNSPPSTSGYPGQYGHYHQGSRPDNRPPHDENRYENRRQSYRDPAKHG